MKTLLLFLLLPVCLLSQNLGGSITQPENPAMYSGSANQIVATPNGSSGAANVRAMVAADLPSAVRQSTSQKVVYTSQIPSVVSDADVTCGMLGYSACTDSSYGTDEAAAINAVLSGGNIHLIVDGQYSLSTSLIVYGNTFISGARPTDGFIMRPGSNATVIVNAHQNAPTTSAGSIPEGKTYGPGYLVSNVTDTNIAIESLILNANSLNATTDSSHKGPTSACCTVFGILFEGVSNVSVRHISMWDTPTFGIYFLNASDIRIDGSTIQNPDVYDNYAKNTDCIHFTGPDEYIWITNEHLTCGDDSIALNADDGTTVSGPINDVTEDNIFLDGSQLGPRIISMAAPVTRIHFHHFYGKTYRDYLNIDTDPSGYPTNNDGGYVGTVDASDFSVTRMLLNPATENNTDVQIAATSDSITLSGFQIDNPSVAGGDTGYVLHVWSWPVSQLNLRDWQINDPNGDNSLSPLVELDSAVTNLNTDGMNWIDASGGSGYFFGGSINPSNSSLGGFTGPTAREFAAGFYGTFADNSPIPVAVSFAIGPGAGTGGTIDSGSTAGTSTAGIVKFTTGTSPPAATTVLTVNFTAPWTTVFNLPGPSCSLTAVGTAASPGGLVNLRIGTFSSSGFTLYTDTGLTASTDYQYMYSCHR